IRLFTPATILRLFASLIHQLLLVLQALTKFLQAFPQLLAIAGLLLQLLPELFPDLIAFLLGHPDLVLLQFALLLLILGAFLGHVLHGVLDSVRQRLMDAGALLFEFRAAFLQAVTITIEIGVGIGIARTRPLDLSPCASHAATQRQCDCRQYEFGVFHFLSFSSVLDGHLAEPASCTAHATPQNRLIRPENGA
ncbi:MAG: hypothetical protein MUC91_11920, partial [Verrucomicrobia bacterium]|nr:hypothetical protein [Verrucomicrobiota bacterium]